MIGEDESQKKSHTDVYALSSYTTIQNQEASTMSVQLSSEEKRARMARALAKDGFEDVYVLDAESAAEVLTPKRRELLNRLVSDDNVRSVRSLAESVGRDKGAVSHDLELLANHDLVTFEREGKRKVPKAKHQTVVVEPVL